MGNKNYLAELYGLEEITAKNISITKNNKGHLIYEIENKEFLDTDEKSKALYEDWERFLKRKLPDFTFVNKGDCEITATYNKTFILSADYIGPSKAWAAKAFDAKYKNMGKVEEKLADILNVCRRFEGYMIWPKSQNININSHDGQNSVFGISYGKGGKSTVNMCRGGTMGVYDRFDITLYSLKKYFELFIENKKKEYSGNVLYRRAEEFIASCGGKIDIIKNGFRLFNLFLAFELSYEWFEIFETFDRFVQVFELQDFIENGEPVIWCSEDKIAELFDSGSSYQNYIKYVKGCTDAIKSRGKAFRDF